MSQTIASLPFDQVCSTRSGENLFNIIPQTVLVWTETAPTDIPIDNDIINNIDPKQLPLFLLTKSVQQDPVKIYLI